MDLMLVTAYEAETNCSSNPWPILDDKQTNCPSNMFSLITDTPRWRCVVIMKVWNSMRTAKRRRTQNKNRKERKEKCGKCSERLDANQREMREWERKKRRTRGSNTTTSPSGETWILSCVSFGPFETPGSNQPKPVQKNPVHNGDRSMPSEWSVESDWVTGLSCRHLRRQPLRFFLFFVRSAEKKKTHSLVELWGPVLSNKLFNEVSRKKTSHNWVGSLWSGEPLSFLSILTTPKDDGSYVSACT